MKKMIIKCDGCGFEQHFVADKKGGWNYSGLQIKEYRVYIEDPDADDIQGTIAFNLCNKCYTNRILGLANNS